MDAHSHGENDEARTEYVDAAREIAARIAARGVHLRGNETPSDILAIEESLERFERAVESHGGDLMMDEAPRGHRGQPDEARFRLPERTAAMSAADYLERLAEAIDDLRQRR